MAKKSEPTPAPAAAPAHKQITINEAEFIRTRDAVITSWTRVHGALQGAIQAYIEHSNSVLGSDHHALSHHDLNVLVNLASAPPPGIESSEVDGVKSELDQNGTKKRKREKKIKDPNAPKRPITAYLLYLDDVRGKIQGELGGDQKRGDISSEATKRWKLLPDSAREKYKEQYQAAWQKYLVDLARYKEENGIVDDEPTTKRAKASGPKPAVPTASAAATEEADAAATADIDSDMDSSVVSSSSDDDSSLDGSDPSDDETEVESTPSPKEPTPPPPPPPKPAKTPKSTIKKDKAKKDKAVEASVQAVANVEPTPATAPAANASAVKSAKKDKAPAHPKLGKEGSFTAINGAAKEGSGSPTKKRKSKAAAPSAGIAEEPKEVGAVAPPNGEKKKKRKSAAATTGSE